MILTHKLSIFLGIIAMNSILAYADTKLQSQTNEKSESRLERGKRLLAAIDGEAGERVVLALQDIAPDYSQYLLEYPFGDIYARPGVAVRDRELVTIAALAAMENAQPQLKVHIEAALNVGVKPEEIVETMMQLSVYSGFPAALNGLFVTKEVFKAQNIKLVQKK